MRVAPALIVLACVAGCATYSERVVLLPSADGRPSALIVKGASGEQQLTAPYEGLETSAGESRRFTSSAADVHERYGSTLAAQPARPLTFMLFFNIGTTDLTADSRARLQEATLKVKSFPAPQVSVIGHADASGTTELNDALSVKRALVVREILIELGIVPSSIEVVGRGARELLVPTNAAEERNRRVEVKLR